MPRIAIVFMGISILCVELFGCNGGSEATDAVNEVLDSAETGTTDAADTTADREDAMVPTDRTCGEWIQQALSLQW